MWTAEDIGLIPDIVSGFQSLIKRQNGTTSIFLLLTGFDTPGDEAMWRYTVVLKTEYGTFALPKMCGLAQT